MHIIDSLAYSLHLGSDRNKKNNSRAKAKSNKSGTTSYANNSIQNSKGLSKVDNHNYRKYDNEQENIFIVRGTDSLVNDVKELYKKEFGQALEDFNNKQTRGDRKIKDYFTHISNDNKHDLACEIIIELGDKKYWDTKDDDFKKKMTNVYKKQVSDLEMLVPNFKIASAIIHYDETSPHMHIVGVPIKEKSKYGMSIQVGKSDVFTKDSLRILQDKMRVLCIESFNKEYGLNDKLKTKQKGRNRDYKVNEMGNYMKMKQELEKHQEDLEKFNSKTDKLDKNSTDIRNIVNNLKTTLTSKDKYILKKTDKNKILNYLDQVYDTNNDYKKVKELSVTLNNVEEELNTNRDKIKTLTENNEALTLRVSTLESQIDKKDKKIEELKEENRTLKQQFEYWKDRFMQFFKFIKNKMFGYKEEREEYKEIASDMYSHGILNTNEMRKIKEDYVWNKENDKGKEKDNLDLSI